MVTRSKFHTKDPQSLLTNSQNLVARATWCAKFVYPWNSIKIMKLTYTRIPRLTAFPFNAQR